MRASWLGLFALAVCTGCGNGANAPADAGRIDAAIGDAATRAEPVDAGRSDAATEAGADAAAQGPLVFVLAGESNSGGIARDSDATATELAPRPSVQILDLHSGTFAFEPLDIGFNNIVDHAGISTEPVYVPNPPTGSVVHGMELGLANAVETGAFPAPVYLIKTGQGGSRIGQWAAGTPYWQKFVERTSAAKAKLPGSPRWVVWYSQGINDALAGMPASEWKTDTTRHLARIKAQLPGCQIILTEFQSMQSSGGYPAYNTAIRELVAADPTLASVATDGAATLDPNHWSYAGFRDVVVPALVAKTKR